MVVWRICRSVGGRRHPEQVSIDSFDESWVDIDGMRKLIFGVRLTYFLFVLDSLFDQKDYKNISVLQANDIMSVVLAVNLQSMLFLFPHFPHQDPIPMRPFSH